MEKLFLVALGGALGSVGRYLTGVAALRVWGPEAPWTATLAVNVIGGAAMGVLVGYLTRRGGLDNEPWRLLLAVGVLGGFTTFSAFSLDSVLMLERREYALAGAYVAASVGLATIALWAGLSAARRLFA